MPSPLPVESNALARLVAWIVVTGASAWMGACDDRPKPSGESPPDASTTAQASSSTSGDEVERDADASLPSGMYVQDVSGTPPAPETVLAGAGDIEVTFGDYQRFMRRSLLVAPRTNGQLPDAVPPARRASARAQKGAVRTLLRRAVVGRLAEDHGIEVTGDDIREAVRSDETLATFLPLLEGRRDEDASTTDVPELPEELGPEDVEALARYRVRERKVRDALLESIDPDRLWRIYQKQHDTVRLAFVERSNAPTPENVDAFVRRDRQRDDSRIRAYFETHESRYRRPKLVEVQLLRPSSDDEVDTSTLERAVERLESGDAPGEVADDLGFRHESEAYFQRREHPDAFEAERGDVGYRTSGPRAPHVWRVEGWREAQEPELSRPIRRQIASRLMQESVVPSVRKELERALEIMREVESESDGGLSKEALDRLRTRLDEAGFELKTTESFGRDSDDYVPGMGLAEPVFERAFELTPEAPVADAPILARGDAYAIRLLDRQTPSRKQFEAEMESFRKDVVERRRDVIVSNVVRDWLNRHDVSFDLRPLQVAYGVLRKKKK
jgi:hypothetical protein